MAAAQTLPPLLAAYFTAVNARDFAAAEACFTPDARVHDEARDHCGRMEIRAWLEETIRQYDHHVTPGAVKMRDGSTVVTAAVAGDFPGSPVELDFEFMISDTGISRLTIS